MQKDAVHYNNWEHREVHNLYGFYQVEYQTQTGSRSMSNKVIYTLVSIL